MKEAQPPAAARGGTSGAEAPQPARTGPAGGPPPVGTRVLMTFGERDAALRPAVLASVRALRDAGAHQLSLAAADRVCRVLGSSWVSCGWSLRACPMRVFA